jgi:hypothetical protein
MLPENIKPEILASADDGKNTSCGPAAPEHFNYGDDRHTEYRKATTQNNNLDLATETDTLRNP